MRRHHAGDWFARLTNYRASQPLPVEDALYYGRLSHDHPSHYGAQILTDQHPPYGPQYHSYGPALFVTYHHRFPSGSPNRYGMFSFSQQELQQHKPSQILVKH